MFAATFAVFFADVFALILADLPRVTVAVDVAPTDVFAAVAIRAGDPRVSLTDPAEAEIIAGLPTVEAHTSSGPRIPPTIDAIAGVPTVTVAADVPLVLAIDATVAVRAGDPRVEIQGGLAIVDADSIVEIRAGGPALAVHGSIGHIAPILLTIDADAAEGMISGMTTLAMVESRVGGEGGDLDPRFILIDGPEAILTRAIQRVRLHRGEWVLATNQGPNYFGTDDEPNGVLGRGTRFVNSHLLDELLKAQINASDVSFALDTETRTWAIRVVVDGQVLAITVEVTPNAV